MRGATAQQCRELDAQARADYRIPTLLLMEHAGAAVAQAFQVRVPQRTARVVCVIGRGHNGGDGLAATRLLATAGYGVCVYVLGERGALRDEPALYAEMVARLGVPLYDVTDDARTWQSLEAAITQADWVIDALVGTGFQGVLRASMERAVRLLNARARAVLAVDIPSGLDADTGLPQLVAVRAHVTVCFGWPKQGFYRHEGPRHVGEVAISTITYPPQLLTRAVPS